ncbi:MAG: hypothetical protein IPO36_03290 [Anaerolineales bacterium]|nr:hypothetical protein [Anaerolineales bacterium]
MKPRHVDENEWTWTILGLALLFGIFVRFIPGPLAGLPINDGGMFAVMIRDLKANQFALPVFTSYNHAEIPFAYPPLGLYLGGFFELLGLSEFQMLIWLPAFLTIATVPLFYLLALELLGNRPRAAVATVFFALAPGNYVWYLMGGGLTRALGAVFFILGLYFVHRAYHESDWRLVIYAILCCALTILSHPQAAWLLVIGCAVFWLFSGISPRLFRTPVLIASGTLLLTMPWWAMVISRHGADVFLSASQSGDLNVSVSALITSLLARQTILPFATLFWLLGLPWAIYKRRYDLLVWGFLPYFIDQRSSPLASVFLYPMLAAYGLMDVVPAFFNWFRTRKWIIEPDEVLFNRRGLSMGLLGIVFYLSLECFVHAYVIRNLTLPYPSQDMMAWVRQNTPPESKFIILTGQEEVMTDPVQEWFPALADRHSETTLQGMEWALQGEFNTRWAQLTVLQACRDMSCLNAWTKTMDMQFTHVVVDLSKIPVDMFLSAGYSVIFDNGRYAVLK